MDAVREQLTLRDGRAAYFEANRFGADGGYGLKWAPVKVGPVPLLIPNGPARVRALRLHDLNHVLTGYPTDFLGETEIGCWEIAGGCGAFPVAWSINLAVMVLGSPFSLRRSLRAFARGRRTRNLYHHRFDEALLERSVDEVRTELGLEAPVPSPEPGDVVRFAGWYLVGLLQFALPGALLVGAWLVARQTF